MQAKTTTDPFHREQPPLLIVISGPSGVGKDAVVKRMKERGCPFEFVVTATDRPRRVGEVEARDYYFFSTAEFEAGIAQGEFLEYAKVYGQWKGSLKREVRRALDTGLDAVMRVDVQGAATVRKQLPQAVSIFLTCESVEELERRLRERRTEPPEALKRRLETATLEMACMPGFDYVVVNRRCGLDAAVDDVMAIIRAEHCRSLPQKIVL
jgi:guanylate kinase